MILENSMFCEELSEVQTLMLRDKNLGVFDDVIQGTEEETFKLTDMCNLECVYASHNYLTTTLGFG